MPYCDVFGCQFHANITFADPPRYVTQFFEWSQFTHGRTARCMCSDHLNEWKDRMGAMYRGSKKNAKMREMGGRVVEALNEHLGKIHPDPEVDFWIIRDGGTFVAILSWTDSKKNSQVNHFREETESYDVAEERFLLRIEEMTSPLVSDRVCSTLGKL